MLVHCPKLHDQNDCSASVVRTPNVCISTKNQQMHLLSQPNAMKRLQRVDAY